MTHILGTRFRLQNSIYGEIIILLREKYNMLMYKRGLWWVVAGENGQ